ncbi:P-type DNA transfer protein VirB5 [Citrobacter koseri]|uniref:P-type DNA transfer protein VirB5 n=1 Tax=Citrobacter koseri TaxID=545 RepID=A0A2X2W7M3_CITKO|nr:P-type DNA transfer protein VirB5 [Citrobacter koseri]
MLAKLPARLNKHNLVLLSYQVLVRRGKYGNRPKEVMDLNARIGAEQAFLQNEVGKLQVLQQTAQANDALYQQKVKQMAVPIIWLTA